MPTALTHIGSGPTTHLTVKGFVLEGMVVEPRNTQRKITKFWGVNNESHIYGGRGGRQVLVPVIIYDVTDFDTARKVANYVNNVLNGSALGTVGTVTITSLSDHAPFDDCTYDGFELIDGPKHDDAGTLGGQYWCLGRLVFRQLS